MLFCRMVLVIHVDVTLQVATKLIDVILPLVLVIHVDVTMQVATKLIDVILKNDTSNTCRCYTADCF